MPFSLRKRITRSSAAAAAIATEQPSLADVQPSTKMGRACDSNTASTLLTEPPTSKKTKAKAYLLPVITSSIAKKSVTPPPSGRRKAVSAKLSPTVSDSSDGGGAHGGEMTGSAFEGKGPRFLRQVNTTPVFDKAGKPVPIEFEAGIAKGFFRVRNNWTCYRRNYIAVAARLCGPVPNVTELRLPDGRPIDRLSFSITATTCDRHPQQAQLVQHTAKRDKGPQLQPAQLTVSNPAWTAAWERLQFRTATANNGKKKTHQQYYSVKVTLSGIVLKGASRTPDTVVLAHSYSEPVVVRGRSPGHYNDCAADAATDLPEKSMAFAGETGGGAALAPSVDRICHWLEGADDSKAVGSASMPVAPEVSVAPYGQMGMPIGQPSLQPPPMPPLPLANGVGGMLYPSPSEPFVTSAQSNLGGDYLSAGALLSNGISAISPLPQYTAMQPAPTQSLRQSHQRQLGHPSPGPGSAVMAPPSQCGGLHAWVAGDKAQRLPSYAEVNALVHAHRQPVMSAVRTRSMSATPAVKHESANGDLSRQEAVEALFALSAGG